MLVDGSLVTIAGTANKPGFTGDNGPAGASQLNTPTQIVADPNDPKRYWIVDTG
jgi:hypothetical protein